MNEPAPEARGAGPTVIFFVTGASGSGKTACMPALAGLLPEVALHDLDEGGIPAGADKVWRQRLPARLRRRAPARASG